METDFDFLRLPVLPAEHATTLGPRLAFERYPLRSLAVAISAGLLLGLSLSRTCWPKLSERSGPLL